jgi:Flp pilus assembly pilin Flp
VISRELWRCILGYVQRDERGQDLAEYAMLIGFIALVVIGVVMLLGNGLSLLLGAIASEVGP